MAKKRLFKVNSLLEDKDISYFNSRKNRDAVFWQRFMGKPEFKNKNCLDVGCGHGSLCIDMALSGAKKVVGVDIDSRRIKFANQNLKINYPELENIIEFKEIDLRHYSNRIKFDFIISQASFEHIIDLNEVFNEMKNRLQQNGKIYIGFGDLYNSPLGDHSIVKNALKVAVPWGHKIVPESILIKRLNKHRENKINSIQELGLNKWSLKDYKKLLKNSGLSVVFFKVNNSDKIISKLFSLIGKIPLLEEYFSFNIYCILQNNK